jgi:hypothetical protein
MFGSAAAHRWTFLASGATLISGRGTQVVRKRSAKPLCVGSISTRASSNQHLTNGSSLLAAFVLRNWSVGFVPCPAAQS